jgi:hypothetical protein
LTTQRRAALLRVRKRVQVYHSLRSLHVNRFETLWESMRPYRKNFISLELPNSEYIGEEGETHISLTENRSSRSSRQLLSRHDVDSPPTPDSPTQLSPTLSDSNLLTAEVSGAQTSTIAGLTSMFEQDISLLFATKSKVSASQARKSLRESDVGSDTGSLSSRSSTKSQHRRIRKKLRHQKRKGLFRSKMDSNIEDDYNIESDSDDDIDDDEIVAMDDEEAVRAENQKNLGAVIEKMKAMGVYAAHELSRKPSINFSATASEYDRQESLWENFHSALDDADSTFMTQELPTQSHIDVNTEVQNEPIVGERITAEKLRERAKILNSTMSPALTKWLQSDEIIQKKLQDSVSEQSKLLSIISMFPSTETNAFQKSHLKISSNKKTQTRNIFLAQQTLSLNVPMTDQLESKVDNHLKGRWQYDQSIARSTPVVVHRTGDVYRQGNMLLLSEELLQARAIARASERQARSEHRQLRRVRNAFLALSLHRDVYREIIFNDKSNNLCLLFKEGEEILFCVSVPIESIFVTDNPLAASLSHSIQSDLVLLRTNRVDLLPGGYLGGFPALQWKEIESEMNKGMMKQRKRERLLRAKSFQQESNKTGDNDALKNIRLEEKEVGDEYSQFDDSVVSSHGDHQPRQFNLLTPVTERRGNGNDVSVSSDEETDRFDRPLIIPRLPGLMIDFPVASPALTQALPPSLTQQLRLQRRQHRSLLSAKHHQEEVVASAMSKIRVNRPNSTSLTVEPNRFENLVPDMQPHMMKPPTMCGDDVDIVLPEPQICSINQVHEQLALELSEIPFRLAAQTMPISLLPPVLKPLRETVGEGYFASGFVACNQPVSFQLNGLPRSPPPRSVKEHETIPVDNKLISTSKTAMTQQFTDIDRSKLGRMMLSPYAPLSQRRRPKSFRTSNLKVHESSEDTVSERNSYSPPILNPSTPALSDSRQPSNVDYDDIIDSKPTTAAPLETLPVKTVSPEKRQKFSYEFQIIMLIETRRLMQVNTKVSLSI